MGVRDLLHTYSLTGGLFCFLFFFFCKFLSFPHGYLIAKVRTGTILIHASQLRLGIFCLVFFFSFFFYVLSANFPTITQRILL